MYSIMNYCAVLVIIKLSNQTNAQRHFSCDYPVFLYIRGSTAQSLMRMLLFRASMTDRIEEDWYCQNNRNMA